MDKDYENFVQRMGSFDDIIEIDSKNILQHYGKKGMKWGKHRYVNKDNSLTKQGLKRYERDQRENAGRKKGNKIGQADPDRWVKEDLSRSKNLADNSSRMINELNKINNDRGKFKKKQVMNLSLMNDKEMREQINRAFLEKQYNDLFNPQKEAKGKETVNRVLQTAGSVLAVASTSLGIALAIKELKG